MNGAQALVATLVGSGVTVSFANPGTSEMHFVTALDSSPEMRGVLCLFEGVVTGAADGYGRMADRPASTLLHLGPGLGNGLANLHNARRARTPMVNVVGDHATYHKRFDAPLESDIDALAHAVSRWVRRPSRPEDVGPDAAEAVAAAPIGRRRRRHPDPAGGCQLGERGDGRGFRVRSALRPGWLPTVVADAAKALNGGEPAALLLGGPALRQPGLAAAARIAAACGARVIDRRPFRPGSSEGPGGRRSIGSGYFAEAAEAQLAGVRHLVLAGAPSPVAFFAYPDRPSDLVPPGCSVHRLADPGEDVARKPCWTWLTASPATRRRRPTRAAAAVRTRRRASPPAGPRSRRRHRRGDRGQPARGSGHRGRGHHGQPGPGGRDGRRPAA